MVLMCYYIALTNDSYQMYKVIWWLDSAFQVNLVTFLQLLPEVKGV